jgi:hypothetical protein
MCAFRRAAVIFCYVAMTSAQEAPAMLRGASMEDTSQGHHGSNKEPFYVNEDGVEYKGLEDTMSDSNTVCF